MDSSNKWLPFDGSCLDTDTPRPHPSRIGLGSNWKNSVGPAPEPKLESYHPSRLNKTHGTHCLITHRPLSSSLLALPYRILKIDHKP